MSSERQNQIMAYLMEHNTATVHRLAQKVYACEATVRRDLAALERSGHFNYEPGCFFVCGIFDGFALFQ